MGSVRVINMFHIDKIGKLYRKEKLKIYRKKRKSESEHWRYDSLMGSVRAINMFAGDAALVTLIATSIFLPHKKITSYQHKKSHHTNNKKSYHTNKQTAFRSRF